MTGEYPILAGNEAIGTATVTREGLYYRLECHCTLSGEVLYKVLITGDGLHEDLGICVPQGNGFGMRTKVPVKRLAGKCIRFLAVPRHGNFTHDVFVVTEGSPFDYISKLENAFLVKRDGQYYIALSQVSDSS